MIRRALLSCWDKTGLGAFARGLHELGVELIASGGTAAFLEDERIPVIYVESVTGFPELLAGRVKTLHPKIHAGILARRDVEDDIASLEEHGIGPIDLVSVSLYPFESVVARLGVAESDAIEMIDIGGPALLRAAAKNHADVVPLCRTDDYEPLLQELRSTGTVSPASRRLLAHRAFAATSAYDAAIAAYLGRDEPFPETLTLAFERELELAYGENPHQRGAYYAERGRRTHLLSRIEQRHGKPLSYNNLNDLSAARLLIRELEGPACVIVKHANPCGVGIAPTIGLAYDKALAADPVSAYGGVVVLSEAVPAALGERLAEQFIEVLFAPGYDEQALEAIVRKPGIRLLDDLERRSFALGEQDFRRVIGGVLVQDRDERPDPRQEMAVACGTVLDAQWADVLFAWSVVRHVSSNAIVLARDGQTLGIGAGQMSRVDAVRIAVEKARELGHSLESAVLASDAFFPFADGPEVALAAGVTTIVQPGGSKRDEEVIAAVEAAGAAMVLTHRRHFRH